MYKNFIVLILAISTFTFSAILKSKQQFTSKDVPEDIVKVAVIDTGFDFDSSWPDIDKQIDHDGYKLRVPKFCDGLHRDFTGTGIDDNHKTGHGTHVAGIIAKVAKDSKYCIVVLKAYDVNNTKKFPVYNALKYAYNLNVDIINYSAGGRDFYYKEYKIVQKLLNKGVVFVTAAGNNSDVINYTVQKVKNKSDVTFIHSTKTVVTKDVNKTYFPAIYDPRIIAVQNKKRNGILHPSSNRGAAFKYAEVGVEVFSIMPNNKYGTLTGTSQAVPTKVGKIIRKWDE